MKLNEIKLIPQDDFAGEKGDVFGHDTEDVRELERTAKKLPGGSHFTWNRDKQGRKMVIYIFDPEMDPGVRHYPNDPNVIGKMALERGVLGWAVEDIMVFEEYRSKRLGLALYGLALDTMKLTLVSDSAQTPNGQKMWKHIASIPGTKVQVVFSANEAAFGPRNLTEKGRKIWDELENKSLKNFVEAVGGDYADVETGKYWALPVKIVNGKIENDHVNVYGSYFAQLIASRS